MKNFNLYVPGGHTFENYFLPRIKKSALEHFQVNAKRHGVQRGGNNHLVVFLDFHAKKPFPDFIGAPKIDFTPKSPSEIELFKKIHGNEKEVSLFSITYPPKMSALAWKLLIAVADDGQILVEDDGGHFKEGPDCVGDLKQLFAQKVS